jgi:hypothetical protein
MDNNSPNAEVLTALVTEAKRIEEDSLYSSKGHLEASRTWDRWHYLIGVPTALTAAVAGVSALNDYPTISACLALLVAATSALMTFLNPKDHANAHVRAGNLYGGLRNDARIFHTIQSQITAPSELAKALLELNSRRNTLNSDSPRIPRGAFERARTGIESGEATYAADELPKKD